MGINYAHLWCTFSFAVSLVFHFYRDTISCSPVLLFSPVQSSRFLTESLVTRPSCADISMNDGCLGERERGGSYSCGNEAPPLKSSSLSLSRGSHSLRALARLPSLDARSLASTLFHYKGCGFRGVTPPPPPPPPRAFWESAALSIPRRSFIWIDMEKRVVNGLKWLKD